MPVIPTLLPQGVFPMMPDIKRLPRRHKHSKSKDTSNDPLAPKKYRCAHCTWSFSRPSDLKRHLKSHSLPQYHCPFWNPKYATCPHKSGGSFNRLDVLKRHLKLVHYEPDVPGMFKNATRKKNKENVEQVKQSGGESCGEEFLDEGNKEGERADMKAEDAESVGDGGTCLSCNTHFDHAKDFITHVPECAETTPMKKWKYKKNGVIAYACKLKDKDPVNGVVELSDELQEKPPVYSSRPQIASPIQVLDTSVNRSNTDEDDKKFISVNDLDNKPEVMTEALNRKRGRPKKTKSNT